jgi:uncharacterized protein (DUF1330 family)
MSKGYWVAHVMVKDPETYKSYVAGIQLPLAKYGGRYLVRAGEIAEAEGALKPRTVVIEFPTVDAARACYASAEYQAAKAFRLGAAEADLVVIAGYDGAQPGTA